MKAFIGIIITIVVIFTGIVAGYSVLQADVNRHTISIIDMEDRTQELEMNDVKQAEQLKNIQEDVSEIKTDVKRLLQRK